MRAVEILGDRWFVKGMGDTSWRGLFHGGMDVRRRIDRECIREYRVFCRGLGKRRRSWGLIMIFDWFWGRAKKSVWKRFFRQYLTVTRIKRLLEICKIVQQYYNRPFDLQYKMCIHLSSYFICVIHIIIVYKFLLYIKNSFSSLLLRTKMWSSLRTLFLYSLMLFMTIKETKTTHTYSFIFVGQ